MFLCSVFIDLYVKIGDIFHMNIIRRLRAPGELVLCGENYATRAEH